METSILTDDQKRQWTEDGYLLLKGVLSPHEVKNLAAAVDKMYAEHLKQPDAKPEAGLNRLNIVEANNIFVKLIAYPVTFPVVLELLDSFIQLSMSQAMIRPPTSESKGFSHALHPDGGQAMRQIRVSKNSLPLQIKIQYFLTALPTNDAGNFTVVPGSHLNPFPEEHLGDA